MAVGKLFGLGFLPPKIRGRKEKKSVSFLGMRRSFEEEETPVVFQGWRACYLVYYV